MPTDPSQILDPNKLQELRESLQGQNVGKTTQADLLAKHLRSEGKEVLLTREPGGTDLAEKLRSIVLSDHYNLDSYTQLLLVLAARRNH